MTIHGGVKPGWKHARWRIAHAREGFGVIPSRVSTDPIKEVKRKDKQKGKARRLPVIRMILALILLTAAVLLVFWRAEPKTAGPAVDAPANAPEVILKPLPEGETPPAPQSMPKTSPPSAAQPERPSARVVAGEPKNQIRAPSQDVHGTPETSVVPQPNRPQYRKARLFFAAVDGEGRITLKSVIRPVPIGDSPLLDTLGSLLKGPTPQEFNLGLLSMIPAGSRLLSATMKKDTAVLDFNEKFRYNTLGVEGQLAQLRQVVFASTEFSSVKKVQILIEGKRVDFLGADGVSIGKPFDRDSFQD